MLLRMHSPPTLLGTILKMLHANGQSASHMVATITHRSAGCNQGLQYLDFVVYVAADQRIASNPPGAPLHRLRLRRRLRRWILAPANGSSAAAPRGTNACELCQEQNGKTRRLKGSEVLLPFVLPVGANWEDALLLGRCRLRLGGRSRR